MQSPKVVVLGAGSLFFGRQALKAMLTSPVLRHGTLAYVDTDAERLGQMMQLAQNAIKHSRSTLKLEGSAQRRDVLKQADFVVLSFANQGVRYRASDCAISLRHGIRLCSGDTIGPGGIFRAMRELPEIMRVAQDVAELCPGAWLINYINPTAINGLALKRFTKLKTFALCDGLHMPHVKQHYMRLAGIEVTPENEARFELRIAGVNHFTWVTCCAFAGRDVLDKVRSNLAQAAAAEKNEGDAKGRFNNTYRLQLWDVFGLLPACIGHTKEYVRFWQGGGLATDGLPPLAIFDTVERAKIHEKMWDEVRAYNSGARPMSEFLEKTASDHATDIIEAMCSKAGKQFYINTLNGQAVPNLPADAVLELLCDVDLAGPRPLAADAFPLGLRALQMQILDAHELAAEAIVKSDRSLLLRAFCTDPLTNSIPDAREMIEEVLREEKEALPKGWYC